LDTKDDNYNKMTLDTKEETSSTMMFGYKEASSNTMTLDTKEDTSSTMTFGHKGRQLQYNDVWTQRKTTPIK
jgi:hypothetical protein